jgi:uncharacterized membrane protein
MILAAFVIGVVAGLRSLTAPALVAWGAWAGWVDVEGTWAAWLGQGVTVGILTVLAVIELIIDKQPSTPSRMAPPSFAVRIITGGFSGAALCVGGGLTIWGAIFGVAGAVVGTIGGYAARRRLVAATGGRDLTIALAEDAAAVLVALGLVAAL